MGRNISVNLGYGQPVPTSAAATPADRATLRQPPASGARQSTLRESNLALVTRTVLAAPVPLSRAGVAQQTAMTRSTVSRLVDDLVSGGVLSELDPPAVAGPGRPATPLVAGTGLAALGLQVNATYLAARVLDLRGRVVVERLELGDFVGCDPRATLARLARLSAEALDAVPDGVRLIGAGLALPGLVSTENAELLLAPNLGWSALRPSELLGHEATGGHTVRVDNEANLGARTVAEPSPGRPGEHSDFVYLSGEIGIGGAIVVDGELMTGGNGWAGEVGHVCVDPDGPPCPCGSAGCLEQYAGRRALFTAAGLPTDANATTLRHRVSVGDPRAVAAITAATRALAIALAGVVNVLDLHTIVLGGHLGQIADLLGIDLEAQLTGRSLSARWAPTTLHTIGDDPAPGATGAALQELSGVLRQPARWLS